MLFFLYFLLAFEKIMDSTTNSSRVPVQMDVIPIEPGTAPDLIGLDSDSVSHESYAEVALNLSGRATSDPDDERPPTLNTK